MLLALMADWFIGWPDAAFRRIGHPVTWIGAMVARADGRLNREGLPPAGRRLAGALAAAGIVVAVTAMAWLVQAGLPDSLAGMVLTAALSWPLLAARSLHDHVLEVCRPLASGDLAAARLAVSKIVGRDPASLDEAGVARASVESLAENASDGIVAPLFWGLLFGLPGIAAYKAVNTLDSMIGYRNARYEDFGKFAARLDDAANWIPARLTGLAIAVAGGRPLAALDVMRRDAGLHRSPNAGWPEAAMAAAAGCRLSGPRSYGDRLEHHPWVNEGAPDPDAATIANALAILRRSLLLVAALLLLLALAG
jgi:adenosylcobinamide-phosphate synthase